MQKRAHEKKTGDTYILQECTVEEWNGMNHSVINSAIRQCCCRLRTCKRWTFRAQSVNNCCLLHCIAELNIYAQRYD